jgi:hypothetical protein
VCPISFPVSIAPFHGSTSSLPRSRITDVARKTSRARFAAETVPVSKTTSQLFLDTSKTISIQLQVIHCPGLYAFIKANKDRIRL